MKEFITRQQAQHIKEKHEKERNAIRAAANKAGRGLNGTEKKRLNEIKGIITDAEAVIRGDGRKGKR